jgi:hypothetical protein
MKTVFISAAALHFALVSATAQTAAPSGNQALTLDQQSKISEIITNQTPQPLTNINFSIATDVVVPSNVALRRLPAEAEKIAPVCTENLNPNVLTMKSAQYGARIYDAGSLNLARERRILVQ